MKILLTTLFALIISINSYSQQSEAIMSFDVLKHDYGNISQKDGIAFFEFQFTNTGNTPIIINKVQASCGCTEPTWTDKPILPGGKSIIVVGYNPINRPGHFSKSITIYSNSKRNTITLSISGNVID